jgi:hypothetical protein
MFLISFHALFTVSPVLLNITTMTHAELCIRMAFYGFMTMKKQINYEGYRQKLRYPIVIPQDC